MLSWRLRPLAVQLRGFGRHPLLQAPFLPALQGEGELQPSDQVCIGQARSRGANSTDGGTNSAGGCWILLIMLSSLKWALRAEVWKPCSFFTIVTCCMPCSSSGDTRTYRFHIPLCASSITLLNHGVDVISEEIVWNCCASSTGYNEFLWCLNISAVLRNTIFLSGLIYARLSHNFYHISKRSPLSKLSSRELPRCRTKTLWINYIWRISNAKLEYIGTVYIV